MKKLCRWTSPAFLCLAVLAGVGSAAAQQPAASALPGGASSLQETHGDWQVICGQPEEEKAPVCVFSQLLMQQSQRLLSVELVPQEGGRTARGSLFLPFGLSLADGVSLKVDDGDPSQPLAFRTCLPVGCSVPVSFGENMVAALKAGSTLHLQARESQNGQPVDLQVSLKGFSAALDRAVALTRAAR